MEAIHHKEFKGYTPALCFTVTLPDLRLPFVRDLLQVSSVWLMFVTVHFAPTVTVPFQRTTAQKSGISFHLSYEQKIWRKSNSVCVY